MRTDEQQIAWYREIRTRAAAQLKLIEEGWTFKRAIGGGPDVDITDDFAARERLSVETMDRLIKMYEDRRASN